LLAKSQFALKGLETLSALRLKNDLKALASLITPHDVIFAQMIAPRHLIAWLNWMENQKQPPKLIFHLGYQPHRFAAPTVQSRLECLNPALRDRVSFLTDSEKLVAPLSEVLHATVHYVPHIVGPAFQAVTKSNHHHGLATPVFLSPGNPRKEKGFEELLKAATILHTDSDKSFWMQCHEPDVYCRQKLEHYRSRATNIKWVPGPLTEADYVRLIQEADVVVLPYHLDHYSLRTSGVFCEARVAGKTVIATRNTWAGDRVQREGGGWLVDEKNPTDLANIIKLATQELANKTTEAIALKSGAAKEHSPASAISAIRDLSNCSFGTS